MHDCCNLQYQHTFDASTAQKELRDYQAGKIKKSSRPLVDLIHRLPLEACTMLDIGGGIGVLSFESLKRGATHATHVDISEAYSALFLAEAERRGLRDNISHHLGDFLAQEQGIGPVDLVLLDKVICCYELYEPLVRKSLAKATRWYAYTVPRDLWWVRLGHSLGEIFRRIRGKHFKSYIHPTAEIDRIISEAGFIIRHREHHREWETVLCEKIAS